MLRPYVVPFGYRHGSMCMQRVTDTIRQIMSQRGFYVFNYIDDLIGCDPPEIAEKAYVFLQRLLSELGLDISEEKLYCPQKLFPCLGILVNVTNGMISIPQEKLMG